MGLFDRFKTHKESIPREAVREVVKQSEKVRVENNEYHEVLAELLKRMDNRRGKDHAENR